MIAKTTERNPLARPAWLPDRVRPFATFWFEADGERWASDGIRGATPWRPAVVRSRELEILDGGQLPENVVRRAHRELTYTNLALGNVRAIASAIRCDGERAAPRVLDIGCGEGGVLLALRRRL